MVGKHIFVRCRNDQNNAGTWTAAITDNIVDKDIVRNIIEPRCNMDETFAQDALMSCPTNNVLRIYCVNGSTLLVTRTYWVTDRITETQGRKGAYSVSYILTGEDAARFCTDYSGAFDPACFESYDSLVARAASTPGNKITVSEKESLFAHSEIRADSSLLQRCGLTKASFVQLMNGLYDAVENKKQLAVILPDSIRQAWVRQGDNTAERLCHCLYALLPDFMRMHVGMASHWSCQIKDKMVGDMPLLMVHPRNEDDVAYLKREGAYIVDLDGGRYTTDIPHIAPEYFSFLWDNAGNMSEIEAFWSYCKTNFKKLLRGRPTSAVAMECIFQIRQTLAESYADKARCRKAFFLSANVFAGAGSRVPMAEDFIAAAADVLGIEEGPVDKDVEETLCRLTGEDREKTKHQFTAYKTLLHAMEQGTASPDTLKIMSAEVTKPEREAVPYLFSYLNDRRTLPADAITLPLCRFVAQLFLSLCHPESADTDRQLMSLVPTVIATWTDALMAGRDNWQEYVTPFAEAYITFIRSDSIGASYLSAAYDLLFLLSYKATDPLREACEKALQREEGRIYRNPGATLDNSESRMQTFANALFERPHLSLAAGKEAVITGYERLLRMVFNPVRSIWERALTVYRDSAAPMLESASSMEKLCTTVLRCQETVLKDKPPIWKAEHTESMLVLTEHLHLHLFRSYRPSADRLTLLTDHFTAENKDIYPLFAQYTEAMQADARQWLYSLLKNKGMLPGYFAYLLLFTDRTDHCREVDTTLGGSHTDKLNLLLRYPAPADETDESIARLTGWYEQDLNKALYGQPNGTPVAVFERQLNFIQQEMTVFSRHNGRNRSVEAARSIFNSYVNILFEGLSSSTIGKLPLSTIDGILAILSHTVADKPLANQQLLETVKQLDELIRANSTQKLYNLCRGSLGSPALCELIRDRLTLAIAGSSVPTGSFSTPGNTGLSCRIYLTMMEYGSDSQFNLNALLGKVGYQELPTLDKGMLLVDILGQMRRDHVNFGKDALSKITYQLEILAATDAGGLLDPHFISRVRQNNVHDLLKNTNFFRIMRRAEKNRALKFDPSMLLLCLVGLVLTVLVMGLMSVAVLKLAATHTLAAIIVSLAALVIVIVVDVLLLIGLFGGSDSRRA